MKTTKLLTVSAVATALLPLASLAAIDDQGMQYVSAAEGLHGSLRVNILKKVDNGTDETTGGSADSLRLWITGSGDIGNGWATTYYWEVRDGNRDANGDNKVDAKDKGVIGTEAWTVGLKGPLGAFDFGRSAMVAPRMVPGGSLDTIVGGNAGHFACDVCDNTHRFESATFNGFQFGVSAVTNGSEVNNEDDLIDEYSFAVKYVSPLGFQVGAGYEVDIMHDERYVASGINTYADFDNKTGWRLGARYGQDNWLLGYEYRSYDGYNGWDSDLGFGTGAALYTNGWYNATGVAAIVAVTDVINLPNVSRAQNKRPISSYAERVISTGNARFSISAEFNQRVSYAVHRMGVQVKFDRITASAGYSLETQSLNAEGAVDLDQTAVAVDAAYHLGSNSLIAVGWKKVNTEKYAVGIVTPDTTIFDLPTATVIDSIVKSDNTTTQLYYRVDF